MEEDTSYMKLPVEERCVHKVWKARVEGYEEAAKIFKQIDDESAPEWNKFLGLLKKFVIDSHAMAQEKGLEATLIYVENAGVAGKTVGEVMAGLVAKCMGSPKAKIKDLAAQITLMYIEIEKHEIVMEELIKGLDNKNPKIVSTIVSLITRSLREFGRTVIALKPLVKKIGVLLGDRDKSVRDETKLLTVEIFRWIGAALRPQLSTLNEVMLKELETEFEKAKDDKPEPIRYLRSQQAKAAEPKTVAGGSGEADDGDGDAGDDGAEPIDPMDLIDPVEILSKLPKDFYDKLESKKWQERRESLEALDALLQNPKLEAGDYGDLVRALRRVLTKDSNVVLVAMSGKAIAQLARGLGKKFNTYAGALISGILEKFKEKKPNVVAALRDAIDAIYPLTSLEAMQEDLLEALNNKNPSVKSETASFIARALTKTQPAALNKKLLKTFVVALLKTLNEPDPVVRDSSAEALGTAMKLVGEKAIAPCLTEVDALKMNKIKECCDKAVITVKVVAVKKERPATAPTSAASGPRGGSVHPKPVSRPATSAGANKKPPAKKPAASGGASGSVSKSSSNAKIASSSKQLPSERDLTPEEVDEKVMELLPNDVVTGMADANWKQRLAAVESMAVFINDLDNTNNTSQILVRTMAKKPGFKDTNFQVLKIKFEILKSIAETMTITVTTSDYIINDVVEKLGDAKNGPGAGAALTAIAESISLEYTVTKTLSFIFEQKSPKLQQEGLLWISTAIREFGFQVNPKMMIDDAKKAVQNINPMVRGAGITLLGTLYLYMGNTLATFFDGEKPALKAQIDAEFEKNHNIRPPRPIRGAKAGVGDPADDADDSEPIVNEINISDLIPRSDISAMITDALLNEMADKNWKTRNEGLTKLQGILDEAKMIKPTIGDLPQALAHRIKDSNTKIAQLAIAICENLANCMGVQFKQHIKVLLPGILQGLGDSKSFLKQACSTCITTWGNICGYKEFFECEMIAEALKTGGPGLRIELWGWLAVRLPDMPPKSISKDELLACIPYLFANICDRNAEVRKNANEAILGFMIHVGFDAMNKAMDKQTPALRKDIKVALEKARPLLPVKPLAKGKQQAPIMDDPPARAAVKVLSGGAAAASKLAKPGIAKAAPEKPVSRKKEEEVDTSPLLAVNNTKNQRMIDEQKLRVLKWQFTQPRDEFHELLKEQMFAANVNKSLMANMFHDDFRYHLKVIDALYEDLPHNEKGLMCNLDLVLKWLSLRFYDTNPSVLLKGLDYLLSVANMLVDNGYSLTDIEANSFIPHLLIKIGDPKDTVKNGVRLLIRRFCRTYPYAKMFTFIMDGLKSKNARQRTECLDELGFLISEYGLTAITPSPPVALKEIAKQISDRDNSVRNAALNCIVQAYFLVDEKVYKLIGQISDKDLSMLDERIKRAKKQRPMELAQQQQQQMQQQQQQPMMRQMKPEAKEESQDISEEEEQELPPPDEEHSQQSPYSLNDTYTDTEDDRNDVEDNNEEDREADTEDDVEDPHEEDREADTEDDVEDAHENDGGADNEDYCKNGNDDDGKDDDNYDMQCEEGSPSFRKNYDDVEFGPDTEDELMNRRKELFVIMQKYTILYTPTRIQMFGDRNAVQEPPPPVQGPFGLDADYIKEIERDWIKVDQRPKREACNVDLAFLYSPLKLYEVNGVTYPEEKLKALIAKSTGGHPYMVSPPKPAAHYHSKIATNQSLMNQMNAVQSPKVAIPMMHSAEPVKNADPNIMRMVKGIASTDSMVTRASMNELNEILENADKQAILIDYEEQYIYALLSQFQHLASLPFQDTLIIYQQLLYNVYLYLGSKVLCKRLSVASLKEMMGVLLGLMAETRLSGAGEISGYTKVINGICVKVLDYANFTTINCALIILLRETCLKSTLPKFTDLLMKCVWRNVKMMNERSAELDCSAMLREVHEFLVALPPCWWQQRPSDTPLRTIRTVIHNMVKIRNTAIFDDLPDDIPLNSELRSYVTRIVKTMTVDSVSKQQESPNSQTTTSTDPEFWIKRLNEIKAQNAELQNNLENIPVEPTTPHSSGTHTVGSTYLLKREEDSNRRAAVNLQTSSIKDELATVTDPAARLEFLQKKLAQVQMAKLNRS